MNDNEPIPSPLFTEAARRVERKKTAKVVLEWLDLKESDLRIEETTQVRIGEMARSVKAGLQDGDIYFVVRQPKRINVPIRAKTVTVRLPEQQTAVVVALVVRNNITLPELQTAQGDRQLAILFQLEKTLGPEDKRITTHDLITIKDPDFGPFPEVT